MPLKPLSIATGLTALLLAAQPAHALGESTPSLGTWETTLHARDLQGGAVALDAAEAVFIYDAVLNLTWLRNWGNNVVRTHAQSWADNLTVGAWSDWRLPAVAPVNGHSMQEQPISYDGSTDYGFALTGVGWGLASEMGHLYYVTMGNAAACDNNGCNFNLPVNVGPFQNVTSSTWTGTPASGGNWAFDFALGYQTYSGYNGLAGSYVVAVREGDVLTVPEPGTGLLALSGVSLWMLRRRGPAQSHHTSTSASGSVASSS